MIQRNFFNIALICALTLTIDIALSAADESRSTVPIQGTHQLGCGLLKKDYNLITEYKRLMPQYRYLATYKRFPDYLYSFGIGKRIDDNMKKNSPYSFGVGKRNTFPNFSLLKVPLAYSLPIENKNYDSNAVMSDFIEAKRNAPSRAYGFGIGKRNIPLFNDYNDDDHQELDDNKKFNKDEQMWNQF